MPDPPATGGAFRESTSPSRGHRDASPIGTAMGKEPDRDEHGVCSSDSGALLSEPARVVPPADNLEDG